MESPLRYLVELEAHVNSVINFYHVTVRTLKQVSTAVPLRFKPDTADYAPPGFSPKTALVKARMRA